MNCETCTGLDDRDEHVYCPRQATFFYWDETEKCVRAHCEKHQIRGLDGPLLFGRTNRPGRIKALKEDQARRIAEVRVKADSLVRAIVDEPSTSEL